MESGRQKCEGTKEKREQSKKGGDGVPGSRGWREGGGEGGKVWKLADRIGYAQTGSRAQAQTWEPYLSLRNASTVSPSSPLKTPSLPSQ